MSRKHRGILAVLTVLAAASAGVVGWRSWYTHLPHPGDADRQQLFQWLALRDLERESRETQQVLVDRLQEELRSGVDPSLSGRPLGREYRERVSRNIRLLKRVWFESRVEQYSRLPPQHQRELLERQIGVVELWASVDQVVEPADDAAATAARTSPAAQFFDEIQAWMDAAPPGRRTQMARAVSDGVVWWLATRDLDQSDEETKSCLADRIAEALHQGARHDDLAFPLSDAQDRQLAVNARLLLETWITLRSRQYEQLPADQRAEFIDQQIEHVQSWRVADLFSHAEPQRDAPPPGRLEMLPVLALVDRTLAQAKPDDQPRIRQLVRDVQQRLLWRSLRGALGE